MKRGIIIFARNNGYVDYVKIACASAGYARKHLSGFNEICLITDTSSHDDNPKLIEQYFDRTIISDNFQPENTRLFKDTANSPEYASFKNMGRSEVYDLSPYDETLVIDCDYFIMSDTLDQVWGSENDFMINYQYRDIAGRHGGNISYIDDFTIPMCWATVFFFRRSEYAENLFNLITHIKFNYKYYYALYNCSGNLFRNDFAFAMALHILNGNVSFKAPSLPIDYLNNSFDLDDIFRVNAANDIIMYCAKAETVEEHLLSRFTNTDVHIMNKRAIGRHVDTMLEMGETV
jgi:hypothetical protein